MKRFSFIPVLVLSLPWVVFAAPRSFAELVHGFLLPIFNTLVALLVTAAVTVYFWGISKNMKGEGKNRENLRVYFAWGILILFVMVSVGGILNLLQNTMFKAGSAGTTISAGGGGGSVCTSFLGCGQ